MKIDEENRLRWFGCVYSRSTDSVVRKSDISTIEGNTKGKSRPKLTLEVVIRKDLGFFEYYGTQCS